MGKQLKRNMLATFTADSCATLINLGSPLDEIESRSLELFMADRMMCEMQSPFHVLLFTPPDVINPSTLPFHLIPRLP